MLDTSLAADAITSGSIMDLGSIVDGDEIAAGLNIEDEAEQLQKIKDGKRVSADLSASYNI